MANGIESLPREVKIQMIEEIQAAGGIEKLPRERKIELIQQMQGLRSMRPSQAQPVDKKMGVGQALGVSASRGATLGTAPLVAGLGAGAGALFSKLVDEGKSPSEALSAAREAFGEARGERVALQEKASRDQPGAALVGEIGGGALTLPFTAVRGLKGAAGLGAGVGAAESVSQAEELKDVPKELVKGAALGGTVGVATEGIAKGVGIVGKKAGKFLGDTEIVKTAKDKLKKSFIKTGEAVTGVPEKQIETLLEQGDEIAKLIKQSNGDLTGEADRLRRNTMSAIQKTRQRANASISKAVGKSPDSAIINTDQIDTSIEKILGGLDEAVDSSDIQAINELIRGKIQNAVNFNVDKGRLAGLTLKQAQSLKQQFDTLSKDTYAKGGKIFANSAGVKRAAKAAAGELRNVIADLSPDIKKANQTLSQLRTIEQRINKNLIAEGKSDAALFAAGADTNKRNAAMLKRLGEITGTKPLKEAEKLSAARQFADAKLLTFDTTGKGVERTGKAAIVGGLVAGAPGAVAGALLTSPKALQTAIRAGQITKKMAGQIFESAVPKVKSILIQEFGRGITGGDSAVGRKEPNAIERRLNKGQQ